LLDDFDAEAFQTDDLAGVVGQEADAAEAEVYQDLRSDACLMLQRAGKGRLPGLEEDERSGAGCRDLAECAADGGVGGEGIQQIAVTAMDAD
jgi:hypothetical protein